jgi:molybdate transport repressor ModE-like protein
MLAWDDFRYVKAIADTGSLNGAAQSLGVNHSTMFRRLAQIEQQLGSRLFERRRGGYVLTTCGEEMVRLAERFGGDIAAFERKITGQDLRPSGELRITTNDMVMLHILADVLVGFRRAFPEIVLDIVVSNAMLNLSRRDADVAVRATYYQPPGLAGQCVARIAWAVYGSSSSVPDRFDPNEAARYDWIGVSDHSSMSRAAKWMKDHAGGNVRIVCKVNTLLGMAQAAAGGVGLVLLPCFIGAAVPGLVRLTLPVPELEGEFWLLTHPDLQATARVRAFVDYCAEEMGKRKAVLEGREGPPPSSVTPDPV